MATFETVTKDNEVTDINLVQVKKIESVQQEEILTLSHINTRIAVIDNQIAALEQEKSDLLTLQTDVEAKA